MARSARSGGAETNTSVDQVFDVLDVISEASESVGVVDVARRLGLSTSTAHRVLVTLHQTGYLGRDVTGTKYRLGIVAHELADALFRRFPVRDAAAGHLRRLVEITGQTASLEVRLGWHAVSIAGEEGPSEIHSDLRLGKIVPLDQSASGKVILASLRGEDLKAFRAWRGRSGAARNAALEAIRVAGYVVDEPSTDTPVRRVAFPVRDLAGTAIAAVSLEGPASDFDPAPASARFRSWQGIVADLETTLQSDPDLLRQPYGHLPAEDIEAMLTG